MGPIVVCLYMIKVGRVFESGASPVELPHPSEIFLKSLGVTGS